MKLIDIMNPNDFDEALESAMALATGSMSDRDIISLLRRTAQQVDGGSHQIEHSVLVAFDTDNIKTRHGAEQMILAMSFHAVTFMPRQRVIGMLERKATEYEDEIA